jgi:predicted O-methyltransferase YrrM
MNAANAALARPHTRLLDAASLDRILAHWLPIFGLSMTKSALAYLAHRICLMEDLCEGRIATTINAMMLRLLAMRSLGPAAELKVLEIGTLFGIGAGLLHAFRGPDIGRVRLTLVDPLSGYYAKGMLDPATGVPITAETVLDNLTRLRVPREDVVLLRGLSQDPQIRAEAARSRYDVLVIDGDHSREGVRRDFELYASLVEPGGIVLFDDYDTKDWPEVKEAVDRLLADAEGWTWLGSEWRTGILKSARRRDKASPASGTAAD